MHPYDFKHYLKSCCQPSLTLFVFHQNSNNPTYHRIYEHIKDAQSYSLTATEGIHRALKGNYAFIGESVSLDLAVARYCNLTRAPEIIGMRGYSIAAPLGMLSDAYNYIILHTENEVSKFLFLDIPL